VRSNPTALVEDLHRGRRGADFDDLLHQGVRHTVEVPIESNVVVDVDRSPRPLAHIEALCGQGRQRGFFQAVKQTGPLVESIPLQAERHSGRRQKLFAFPPESGLPDEPTIFSMAHELKHHVVDRDLMVTLCGPTDNAVIADDRNAIKIGAEVFAAEFIHPEADFVRDLEKIGSPCDPKALVRLKEAASTSLSYQAMVKRSLRLGLLHYTDELRFEGLRWGLLEKRLFGRRLSDARRQQRLGRQQQA
jgi:hypothetical protein